MSASGRNDRVYMDHAATTPLDPAVFEAMRPYLRGTQANPSSLHASGRRARAAVDRAREQIADLADRVLRGVTAAYDEPAG